MFNAIRKYVRSVWINFRDKAGDVEVFKRYGTQDWAQRMPVTQRDVDAPKVNANAYIATRAISDAIKGLNVNITEVDTIGGIEREVDDSDSPANDLLVNPNPEHSWSDVVDHIVKSYLNDGNALLTIEKMTGPNGRVEIWPRDPRDVDISTHDRSYLFGKYTRNQITYKRDRVIHIRDMSVGDPFWGVGRVSTIREEISMDYFVNRFNSNFFEHGATLNLMFTPDNELTEDQHQQILDAMNCEVGGVDNAFRIFINRYAGKFTSGDQKHKDIEFLNLLKSNREKIFGVFGLPPFRGGVMEYANYANALAQDRDFWLNTIKPILKVIEDAFNKQLLWPMYGPDVRLRFDLDSIPAIKGDPTEIEDRLIKLKKAGIVSPEYVREQLAIEESAAPKKLEMPDEDDVPQDGQEKESTPPQNEQEEVDNTMFRLFRLQRRAVIANLSKMTSNGDLMCVLCDPTTQSKKLYNTAFAGKSMRSSLIPIIRQVLVDRGVKNNNGNGVFDTNNSTLRSTLRSTVFKIEDMIDQSLMLVKAVLDDADHYKWSYRQVERKIKHVFSYGRSRDASKAILTESINNYKLVSPSILDDLSSVLSAPALPKEKV